MAWRKVHLGDEVWEWRTGKSTSHYIYIRSPSKTVTRVFSSRIGAVKTPTRDYDDDGPIMAYAVKPGLVKAYIEGHRDALSAGSGRRKGRRACDW